MSPGRAGAHAEDARSALTRRPFRSYPWWSALIDLPPAAAWTLVRQLRGPHLSTVRVMEQAVEQRGDGGGVSEELSPVVDRPVRGEQRRGPLVAAHDQLEQVFGGGVRQLSHARGRR